MTANAMAEDERKSLPPQEWTCSHNEARSIPASIPNIGPYRFKIQQAGPPPQRRKMRRTEALFQLPADYPE